jgi:hypothetical protein
MEAYILELWPLGSARLLSSRARRARKRSGLLLEDRDRHSVTTTEIYAHLAPNEVREEATKVLNGLNG